MAVKIRLKRFGKKFSAHYRVVVMDSRAKRDGRAIEEIGQYHPTEEPSFIEINSERAQYWLGVGAQPTEQAAVLLKITGDWQKFKGEPGAEGTLKAPQAKRDKTEAFNEALKDSAGEPKTEAVTKKTAKKSAKAKDETPEPTETPAAESPEGAAAEADQGEAQAPDAKGADTPAAEAATGGDPEKPAEG